MLFIFHICFWSQKISTLNNYINTIKSNTIKSYQFTALSKIIKINNKFLRNLFIPNFWYTTHKPSILHKPTTPYMIILNFKLYFTIFILYTIINFYNYFLDMFSKFGVNTTGICPNLPNFCINLENNEIEIWDLNEIINTQLFFNLSFLLFFLLMYLNYRLYGR